MNKLAESRTRRFEAANADFRTASVYFGLAFVHLFRAAKHIITGLALSFIFITAFSQKVNAEDIWTLDFEDAGGYTTSIVEFTDGAEDYFTRTDGGNIESAMWNFTNLQESWAFVASDTDGIESTYDVLTLEVDDIDISGYTDLTFYVFIAEDDDSTNQDWDDNTELKFQYDINNSGSWTNLIWVEGSGGTNTAPYIDTDCDGIGDGTEITAEFVEFSSGIVKTGSLIDIKVTFSYFDANDEDVAIDSLRIAGTSGGAPDPPPCAISNLTALTGSAVGTIWLQWTAPGGDGTGTEDVTSYEVKYATKYIGTSDYSASWTTEYTQSWTPAAFGTEEGTTGNRVISGLSEGVTYWFAIKATDGTTQASWTSSGTVSSVNTLNSTYAKSDLNLISSEQGQWHYGFEGIAGVNDLIWEEIGTASGIDLDIEGTRRSGSNSCLFENLTTAYTGREIWSSTCPVTVGKKYTVGIWANVPDPGSGATLEGIQFEIEIRWYNAADEDVSQETSANINPTVFGQWRKIILSSITAPANATQARLAISAKETEGKSAVAYLDDAEFYQVVEVGDTTAPCAVSNLTALAEGSNLGGRVQLKWSAPGDDGMSENNTSGQYLVKYATKYVGSGDFYATWMSTWGYLSSPGAVGSEELKVLTGFSEGTTYWFAIKTKDSDNNWSVWPGTAANINSLSWSIPTSSAPATVTTLSALTGDSGGEIDLTWSCPGDDGTTGAITDGKFAIRYATYTNVVWTSASSEWTDFDDKYELVIDTDTNNYNEVHSRTMTSLHEGVTYYFRLKTADERPNWSELSNYATAYVYTMPPPPSPEGILVYYSSSTTPSEQQIPAYRYWDGAAWAGEDVTVDVGGAASQQNVVRMCPSAVRDEAIMANVDALADLNVSTYTPSGGWGLAGELTDNVGIITKRVFDIAYEQTSGDAVIVYRTGTGATSELYYKTWNGTALSGPTEIGDNIINVQWVRLEPNPLFDEMTLVYSDNLGNIYSYIWNGSFFGNAQDILTGRASASTAQPFDIAYAQSAGVGFVVWVDTMSAQPKYRTWDGYSWSAETTTSHNHSAVGDARWIKAAANPLNNEIMIGTFDNSTDINAEVFSSTSNVWMNGTEHDGTSSYGTSSRGFDVAFEATTGEGMIVWAESDVVARATPQVRKYVGGAWLADNAAATGNDAGIKWVSLAPDDASDDIFLIALDTANYVYSQRWNGGAWDTPTEISNNSLGSYESAGMNFPRPSAPTDSIAPAAVTSFTASTTSVSGRIDLSWVCPGDDYRIGAFAADSKFRIQWATYSAMDWGTYGTYNAEITTSAISAQNISAYSTSGLIYETTYYFRLWTRDEVDEAAHWSEISVGATAYCRVAPAAVTALSALAEDDGDVALTWIAPGDDGTNGSISDGQWKIRYATYSAADWTTASSGWTDYDDKYEFLIDTSCAALSERSRTMTGLRGGVIYYFRLWTRDENTGINAPGNWSEISNGSTATVVKVIGVSVSTDTYNFGEVALSSQAVSTTTIIVTNTGNVSETYSIKGSSAIGGIAPWTLSDTVGNDKFALYTAFHNVETSTSTFGVEDRLTYEYAASTATKFSIDGTQTGVAVAKDDERKIWIMIKMPTTTTTSVQKKATVTVLAGESP